MNCRENKELKFVLLFLTHVIYKGQSLLLTKGMSLLWTKGKSLL